MTFIPAQTNLQLYRQLQSQGFGVNDIELVGHTYDLSCRMLADYFRPTQKPFTCHLVGCSSVAAKFGGSIEIVAASIAHSIYEFGQLKSASSISADAKRSVVRACTSTSVEKLIHDYSSFNWRKFSKNSVRAWRISGEMPSEEILLMKLADIFDDLLDGSTTIAPSKKLAFGLPDDHAGRTIVMKHAKALSGEKFEHAWTQLFVDIDTFTNPLAAPMQRKASYRQKQDSVTDCAPAGNNDKRHQPRTNESHSPVKV